MTPQRALVVLLVLAVGLAGPLPPVRAALINTRQEIAIGRDAAQDLEDRYGLVRDPVQNQRVAAIGARLAAVSDRRDLPWRFRILNRREVNAISLPGGFIYITRGMLNFVTSDDELAFVLGHEVAHVNQRHHVDLLERYFFMGIVVSLLFGGDATASQIANFVGFLLNRGFSRGAEYEADQVGVGLAHRARFRADAGLRFMERLRSAEGRDPSQFEVLFRTHPGLSERITRVREQLRRLGYQAQRWAPGVRPEGALTGARTSLVCGSTTLTASPGPSARRSCTCTPAAPTGASSPRSCSPATASGATPSSA